MIIITIVTLCSQDRLAKTVYNVRMLYNIIYCDVVGALRCNFNAVGTRSIINLNSGVSVFLIVFLIIVEPMEIRRKN